MPTIKSEIYLHQKRIPEQRPLKETTEETPRKYLEVTVFYQFNISSNLNN